MRNLLLSALFGAPALQRGGAIQQDLYIGISLNVELNGPAVQCGAADVQGGRDSQQGQQHADVHVCHRSRPPVRPAAPRGMLLVSPPISYSYLHTTKI